MSSIVKIPSTAITGLPVPPVDPILTFGSLILLDPSHPVNPWPAGVPVNGSTVPNVAAAQALAATGQTADAFTFNNTFASSAEGRVERSTRGGLHVINSPTAGVSKHFVTVSFLTTMQVWLNANASDALYMSLWGRVTRPTDTSLGEIHIARIADTTNYWVAAGLTPSTGLPNVSPTNASGLRQGFTSEFNSTTGDYFAAGTGPSSGSLGTLVKQFLMLGPNNTGEANKLPSFIMERVYVEDLRISGRTHGQVAAIDQAMYDSAKASGGRLSGDTWVTNPTSVA